MPRHSYQEPTAYEPTALPFEVPQLVPDDELVHNDVALMNEVLPVEPSLEEEKSTVDPRATQQILAQRAIRDLPTGRVQAMPTYKPGRWFYDR